MRDPRARDIDPLTKMPIVDQVSNDRSPAVTTRLGEALVADGVVSEQQVAQALQAQKHTGVFLGQVMVDLGYAPAQKIGPHLSRFLGVNYIDLNTFQPAAEIVNLISEELIRVSQAIPVRLAGEILEVAMVDPLDIAAIDRIHIVTGKRVLPLLTMAGELQRTINDLFDAGNRTSEALQEVEIAEQSAAQTKQSRALMAVASEAPIVRLVDSIIDSAMAVRASDIHFEPQERSMRVRLRVDGTLLDHAVIPRSQVPSVIARL